MCNYVVHSDYTLGQFLLLDWERWSDRKHTYIHSNELVSPQLIVCEFQCPCGLEIASPPSQSTTSSGCSIPWPKAMVICVAGGWLNGHKTPVWHTQSHSALRRWAKRDAINWTYRHYTERNEDGRCTRTRNNEYFISIIHLSFFREIIDAINLIDKIA